MPLEAAKKTHQQQWDEAQRILSTKESGNSNPYRITRLTTHPYAPNNSSNPYAHKPHSQVNSGTKQERTRAEVCEPKH